ncbi:hypothetical protein [Winogradskyella arenosi]|uniref:Uncharacterized protein n=1 Tax=Winogradskyella arenosi TaxID=533325 RepID=A0A368ZAQ9_9FLAO|nr:hypothetical protein [Winogradskyella arenosi]RCW88566.1 hypothetical protein DFQ08_1272 [Winogradskyella arenosi]
MKQIIITLTLLIAISISGNAQSNVDVNEMVGFGCYEDGSQSKSVKKISRLIDKEKFNSIIKLLDSENNAEKYLAVIVCEKLAELDKLILTKELNEKITELYKSHEVVSVCSGCVYWDKLTLENILDKENHIRISSNYWLNYKFKSE